MYVQAKYIVQGRQILTDTILEIEQGRIKSLSRPDQLDTAIDVTDLGDVALVPGQINAHSHAFQRLIRGKTEYVEAGREADDFWSWRKRMYDAALSLDEEAFYNIARQVYEEMAMTGITTVGEFHYVHHQPDGTPYDDPNTLAKAAIRAARDVGLRIVLLRVLYNRAGFDQPANPQQRRFVEHDVHVALARIDALRACFESDDAVSVGLAPHSIRAVPRSWFGPIVKYQQQHKMPLHIHACEQRAEIAQSIAEYGKTPIELLRDTGALGTSTTLVHATHMSDLDLDLCRRFGPIVCACPSTERNLGDGFLPALDLLSRKVRISLGSDAHANVDLWDEMRLVEYHERLRYERRNVLAQTYPIWFEASPRQNVADLLWPMSTQHGAESLMVEAGALRPGLWADMTVVDLSHWSIRGTTQEDLLSDLVFSLKPGAIKQVYVAGQPIIHCS